MGEEPRNGQIVRSIHADRKRESNRGVDVGRKKDPGKRERNPGNRGRGEQNGREGTRVQLPREKKKRRKGIQFEGGAPLQVQMGCTHYAPTPNRYERTRRPEIPRNENANHTASERTRMHMLHSVRREGDEELDSRERRHIRKKSTPLEPKASNRMIP